MIPTGRIPISREQVQNAIMFLKAEISIREQRLSTMKAEGAAWRMFQTSGPDGSANKSDRPFWKLAGDWQQAHKAKEDAEAQYQELELMKLKSQLAIQEAMLNDGDQNERKLISNLT